MTDWELLKRDAAAATKRSLSKTESERTSKEIQVGSMRCFQWAAASQLGNREVTQAVDLRGESAVRGAHTSWGVSATAPDRGLDKPGNPP